MGVYRISEGCFVAIFQSQKGKVSLQGNISECLGYGLALIENLTLTVKASFCVWRVEKESTFS
jgi:hypothetical protein